MCVCEPRSSLQLRPRDYKKIGASLSHAPTVCDVYIHMKSSTTTGPAAAAACRDLWESRAGDVGRVPRLPFFLSRSSLLSPSHSLTLFVSSSSLTLSLSRLRRFLPLFSQRRIRKASCARGIVLARPFSRASPRKQLRFARLLPARVPLTPRQCVLVCVYVVAPQPYRALTGGSWRDFLVDEIRESATGCLVILKVVVPMPSPVRDDWRLRWDYYFWRAKKVPFFWGPLFYLG